MRMIWAGPKGSIKGLRRRTETAVAAVMSGLSAEETFTPLTNHELAQALLGFRRLALS